MSLTEVIIGIAIVLGLLLWAAATIIDWHWALQWFGESPGSCFAAFVAIVTLVLAWYACFDQRSLPWTVFWSALGGIAAYVSIRLWRD
jgi:hypothetical protein